MKHLSIAILALFCVLSLSAGWEIKIFPTLMVNLNDQLRHVPQNRGLQVTTASKVERNQPFTVNAAIMLKKPLQKAMDFSGHITFTSPDGKTEIPAESAKMFSLPAGTRGIHISPHFLKATFDPPDKCGKYRFSLTVKDDSGNARTASTEVELVDSITDFRPMDNREFYSFVQPYYTHPKPERLLAALNYFLSEGIIEMRLNSKRFNALPTLYFFAEVFRNNPQFFDELAKMSGKDKPKDQYLAILFYQIGQSFLKPYKEKINPYILKQISRIKKPLLTEKETVRHFQQLDLLWAEFYANGNFNSIRRITDCLRRQPELSVSEAKKITDSGKKLTAEQRQHLLNSLNKIAASMSMVNNIKKGHRLAGFYLETILVKKLYPDETASRLISEILINAKSTKKGNK